jgi:hypothetical protein
MHSTALSHETVSDSDTKAVLSRAASLALTAAALFVAGCSKSGESPDPATAATPAESGSEAAASGDVKCLGINECKGQAQCGGAPGGHSCAGQNECKGKGWLKVSAAECTEKGGSVL